MKYVAGRARDNGSFYIDKFFFDRFSEEDLGIYNYIKIAIPDECFEDFIAEDLDDSFSFNVDKYNARKQKELKLKYKNKVEELIAQRYSFGDELSLQRQKEEKPEEYREYYNFAEQCKIIAKELVYKTNTTEGE